jgi:hypothetical protein
MSGIHGWEESAITGTIELRQAQGGQQPIREESAARRLRNLIAGTGRRDSVDERSE